MQFKDQLNRIITLNEAPQRIISLVPSITELLFSLDLGDQIVGRTKFCIHPKNQVSDIQRIGGTKNIHYDRIAELKPDLIIGNKEENKREDVEHLENSYNVWVSDVFDLESAYEMISFIGEICSRKKLSNEMIMNLQGSFLQLSPKSYINCIYLIWRSPWIAVGGGTFINDLLQRSGFRNELDHVNRYPTLEQEQLKSLSPQVVLLSSEPFPFKEKHFDEVRHMFPEAVPYLVDGELFSWYGSRLLHSAAYLKHLHSELTGLI
jgi:ABC-type Fe3+-hydroxamate transport system substrate-binding protein